MSKNEPGEGVGGVFPAEPVESFLSKAMEAQASRVRGQVPRGCWRIEEDDARRPEEVAGRASQRLDVPKAGQGSESKEEMPQNLCRWQWAQRCI